MQFLGTLTTRFQTVATTVDTFTFDHTQGHACIVLIFCHTVTAGVPSSATFNGNAMSLAVSRGFGVSGRTFTVFKYAVPDSYPTGTYTITMTWGTTGRQNDSYVVEYEGLKDDFTSTNGNTGTFSGSPITYSQTLVAQDSWLLVFSRLNTAFKTFNGSSDGVYRLSGTSSRGLADSGAGEGAPGSKSINMTSGTSPSGTYDYLTIELKREISYTLGLTESATTTDVIPSRAETRTVKENESFLERLARLTTRRFTELAHFTEALFLQSSKRFVDSFTATDTFRRFLTRRRTETMIAIERITRSITRTFRENETFQDRANLSGVWIPRTPVSTSWSSGSSPGSSWTKRTKPSTSFTPTSSPSSPWTGRTKPPTTWS